jgi:hypothetical protein
MERNHLGHDMSGVRVTVQCISNKYAVKKQNFDTMYGIKMGSVMNQSGSPASQEKVRCRVIAFLFENFKCCP